MRCPRCGTENPEGRTACVACFAALTAAESSPRAERVSRKSRGWVWFVIAVVAAGVIFAGVWVYQRGLLSGEAAFHRLGQRVEAAKTIYMETTQRLGDQSSSLALAIERPEHVWTRNDSADYGTMETMSDGKNTYGHIQKGDLYWITPSAEFAKRTVPATLAALGAPGALRETGVKRVRVDKGRMCSIKGQRAYALTVDMDGNKGTLYLGMRSLLPLRTRVAVAGGTLTIEYRKFVLDQPLPREVRFSPPAGAPLMNLEAAGQKLNAPEARR